MQLSSQYFLLKSLWETADKRSERFLLSGESMSISAIGGTSSPYASYGFQASQTHGTAATSQVARGECETCKNRTYQDRSDDPSVSFQNPTHITPAAERNSVISHEMEHVRNERTQAAEQGDEVVSQSVSVQTAICPECGRVYVCGGKTVTVTRHNISDTGSTPSQQSQTGNRIDFLV